MLAETTAAPDDGDAIHGGRLNGRHSSKGNQQMNISRFGVLLLACLALPGAACGGSSTEPGPDVPEVKTTHISAAKGGTVAAPDGTSLAIPAGALDADADITLSVGAASNGAKSSVYTFGPDGLKFTKPATLSIKTAGLTPPSGQALALAVLDGTTWTPVEGSTVAGDTVAAPILHFSQYSIVFSDSSAFAALCAANAAAFMACGGDPTGVWKLSEVCPGAGSLLDECLDKTPATGKFKWTSAAENGLVYTFSGGNTWETSMFDFLLAFTMDSSCVPCSAFDGSNNAPSCTASGTECNCTYMGTNPGETTTYSISGTSITNGSSMKATEFCVKGTELWMRDDNGTIARLAKQ